MITVPRCCLSCRAVQCRMTRSSSAFSSCSSSTSGSARGWRCAASTGGRRGSSSSWCPTPSFSSPSRTRAGPGKGRFVKLAYLATQSHRPPTKVGCATEVCGWLLASATSSEKWNRCFFHRICLSLFVSVVAFVFYHCDGAS